MSDLAGVFLPALVAAVFAWLLTPLSARLSRMVGAMDLPGPRRLHAQPVPRLGGLAVIAPTVALLAAGLAGTAVPHWAARDVGVGTLAGLLPILVVSIRDDIAHVSAPLKFLAHSAGAGIAIGCGVVLPSEVHLFGATISLGWTAVPLSFLWLTGVTNAFNLVDGLDGLSAGLGLISASSLVAVLLLARDPQLAAAVAVLAGSVLGFLPHNMHPARVFLGDSGATAIGYLLACFTLNTTALLSAGFATLIPVMLVAVPVADTLVSMLRRSISRLEHGTGQRIYDADADHIHHRLLALGLSHRAAVITLCSVGGLLALLALGSLILTRQQSGYLLAGILFAGFIGLRRLGYNEFALLRRGVLLRLYDLPVLQRSFFSVFADIAMMALALYVAVGLKFDDWNPVDSGGRILAMLAVMTPATVISFRLFGMYRGSWRLAGLDDFRRLFLAVVAGALAGALLFDAVVPWRVPYSLFAIYAAVAVILANAMRVSHRLADQFRMLASADGELAVIYGAGLAGASAARQMLANPAARLRPVGFIDDDPEKVGRLVNGYPILGTIRELGDVIRQLGATVVVVSSIKIPHDRVAEAHAASVGAGARLLRMRIDFVEASPDHEPHATPTGTEAGEAPDARPAAVTSRMVI